MSTNEIGQYIESKLGYQISISEMKTVLEGQMESVTAVKHIVEIILGTISVILGIGGLMGVYAGLFTDSSTLFQKILIGLLIILFALVFGLSFWVLQPVPMHRPIQAKWDILWESYLKHKDDDMVIYSMQLSSYLNAIEMNIPVIAQRSKRAKITTALFIALVVLHLIIAITI